MLDPPEGAREAVGDAPIGCQAAPSSVNYKRMHGAGVLTGPMHGVRINGWMGHGRVDAIPTDEPSASLQFGLFGKAGNSAV